MIQVSTTDQLRKVENAVPGKEFNLETPAEKTKNMAKVCDMMTSSSQQIEF